MVLKIVSPTLFCRISPNGRTFRRPFSVKVIGIRSLAYHNGEIYLTNAILYETTPWILVELKFGVLRVMDNPILFLTNGINFCVVRPVPGREDLDYNFCCDLTTYYKVHYIVKRSYDITQELADCIVKAIGAWAATTS